MSTDHSAFAPTNPATGETIKLALQELKLSGTILPIGATLQVRHIFKSAEDNPIEVIYAFALPRDATLRQFRIIGEGFSAESALKPAEEAQECYERGIEDGSLSTLAHQYQDGIVNLCVGNIRPGETVAVFLEILAGVELRDDGLRLRFPFTLAPSYHGAARMIESAPGQGELELPESFGDLILPTWMQDATHLHRIGFDIDVAFKQPVAEIGSPSHAIKVTQGTSGQHHITLAQASDVPNRDLVLDVRAKKAQPTITGGISNDSCGHFALLMPSNLFGQAPTSPRRLVFLLDRSGSMGGRPIDQAKQALEACLGALSEKDQFGVLAFDNEVVSMHGELQHADARGRKAARGFLSTVEACGGTELVAGFQAAAALLEGEGGDILLITDGQVFGSDEILSQARATGIRLHCLGIGSASADRFLSLLARETGGISRFLTPRERVDLAAIELFASIGQPVANGLRIAHPSAVSLAPEPPKLVRAGEPLLIFGELKGQPEAEICLSWEAEGVPKSIAVPFRLEQCPAAQSVFLLQGSRLLTDAEAKMDADAPSGTSARRQSDRTNRRLENLSRKYGLASRAMSLVAVVKRHGDKAGNLPETKVIPVGMPEDTPFDAYFGSGFACNITPKAFIQFKRSCCPPTYEDRPQLRPRFDTVSECMEDFTAEAVPDSTEDLIVALAATMEPDGGLPGENAEARWVASAIALFLIMEQGSTDSAGTFCLHFRRLRDFIAADTATLADPKYAALMAQIQNGAIPRADWRFLAEMMVVNADPSPTTFWLEIAHPSSATD